MPYAFHVLTIFVGQGMDVSNTRAGLISSEYDFWEVFAFDFSKTGILRYSSVHCTLFAERIEA